VHLLLEFFNFCWRKHIIKKKACILDASKVIVLEVISEKTKYIFMSPHQSAGQILNKNTVNTSFESVYLGTIKFALAKKNADRLHSENALYLSILTICSLCLLFKNVMTRLCNIYNFNFTCFYVVVRLAKGNILSKDGGSERRLEKTA
jgi:hypothetical protein